MQTHYRNMSHKSYLLIYIYIYSVIVIVIFIWWNPLIPSKNLDEVFTYKHICPFEAALMLRYPWFKQEQIIYLYIII